MGDELAWAKSYGTTAAGIHAAYHTGSIGKTFTAVAILQLYERGLLDLDADINDYLPFSIRHPDHPDSPITVRMLLTHTSGLTRRTQRNWKTNWMQGTFASRFTKIWLGVQASCLAFQIWRPI